MYSQHSLSNDIYHSHHQQHGSEDPYYHSSSPSASPTEAPTDFQQLASNHDNHHHQPHGTDLIGRAVQFSTGQFAGQTIRMELQEIQKADLGRKYARVDRRPLDPPPVVLLRMFHVQHHPGSNREIVKELNYESVILRALCFRFAKFMPSDVQVLGLLCTVDLFPVAEEPLSPEHVTSDIPYRGPLVPSAQSSFSSSSSTSSSPTHTSSPTIQQNHYHQPHQPSPDYRFTSTPRASGSKTPSHYSGYVPSDVVQPHQPPLDYRFASTPGSKTPTSHYSGYILPSHSPSDVVHRFGNYPITESSKQTQALAGATFVQPALVDYQGTKSIVFVFADLAVKIEGTFILRYRFFDIFSRPYNQTNDLAITAECYGGMFRVYSTKEFPGLQASTELTKHLARWGVRLNIRETERRRRKTNKTASAKYISHDRKRKRSEAPWSTSEDG